MTIYTKENGCYYEQETTGKHYSLYEMMTYKGNTTSDIVAIFDDDNHELVGWFPGANIFDVNEIDKAVAELVEEYETKQKEKATPTVEVSYRFTKAGVEAFLADASAEFFEDMNNGGEHLDQFDIVVSCGKRKIAVPLGAEEWNGIEVWLEDAINEWEA